MHIDRRSVLKLALWAGATACGDRPPPNRPAPRRSSVAPPAPTRAPARPSPLAEKSIAELGEMMAEGERTARSITALYLARIAAVDAKGPKLGSVIEVNPEALAIAEALDAEREKKGPRGPLHGIPILLKDNIATADGMQTTAGSLGLVGHRPPRDSGVAKRLRAAGAVLLGKTNMSEWANIRARHATSGWSSRGGQCHNPYALARNPCGSSSGSAVATTANLCAAALGTETRGSIICPANACGIVGLKPTLGLVSRAGIIPIADSFDTAGPMTRSVRDAAMVLTALQGVDPRDAATARASAHVARDYAKGLSTSITGKRIGVARKLFGFHPRVDAVMDEALGALEKAGAELVDPIDVVFPRKLGALILDVMLFELKAGLNAYLSELQPRPGTSPVLRSLADVIAYNESHEGEVMPYFGQDLLKEAQSKGTLDDPTYQKALADVRQAAGEDGIDRAVKEHELHAIVAPSGSPAWLTDHVLGDHFVGGSATLAAMAGYPHITVPAGRIASLPVGLSLFGPAWSEPTLLALAFAFEQATHHRVAPDLGDGMQRDGGK